MGEGREVGREEDKENRGGGGGGAVPGPDAAAARPDLPRPAGADEALAELKEITRLAGLELNPEVQRALVELVRLDVVPNAIAQVLKSLCNKSRAQRA